MTSRGAVRFVTNNQIKFSDGVDFLCLRLMNDINRLICGKDHSHSVFFSLAALICLQRLLASVVAGYANSLPTVSDSKSSKPAFPVDESGADGKGVNGVDALLFPICECLREQR